MANMDDNNDVVMYEPTTVIDEVSSTEIYIGTSLRGKSYTSPIWKIKKIWKVGTIWNVGYPTGDQGYGFIWGNRAGLTYA